jgi:hypothetical protein
MPSEYADLDEPAPRYAPLGDIDPMGLYKGLAQLALLTDDMYLSSQVHNLGVVDIFITQLEYDVLRQLHELESTPPATYLLSAQCQMWILAAYEVLRTWQQRVKEVVKLADNGGLELKLKALKAKKYGYMHFGHEARINQIQEVIRDPSIVPKIKNQLLHVHIPFARLEHIRIALAKHEVAGRKGSSAMTPGYGRINHWCGSLDYDLENGYYSMGYISRRDIADSFRALACSGDPPSPEMLEDFDDYMSGKGA